MTVYTAVIEHMSGMDIHTSLTREGLNKKVADYCRLHWDIAPGEPLPPCPVDDEDAVNIYFDGHENDSLTVELSACEAPPAPSEEQVIKALFKRDFVESLRSAMDTAGCCFDWEQLRLLTMEEVCDTLSHNGIRLTCLGHRDRTDALEQYTTAAKLLVAASHHLKCN
jgi:hypothetical protein